jgi:hypothetical protein
MSIVSVVVPLVEQSILWRGFIRARSSFKRQSKLCAVGLRQLRFA